MSGSNDVLGDLEATRAWQEPFYIDLHQHPELSMQETRTCQRITDKLTELGYDPVPCGGGVVGVLRNGEGPTVLLRADMDALPVKEQTGLAYASTATQVSKDGTEVPTMHACGHDFHVTALLGAGELLAKHRDAWTGTLELLFQPGEETAAGAKAMVADGLVDKIPRPDVALGQHVFSTIPTGTVATGSGPSLSTAASIRITIHGKGSHGSMPQLGIDPVLAASALVMRLHGIIPRELTPGEFAVLTVGSVQAGRAANVIPAEATLLVNIRAYTEAVRTKLIDAIRRVANAECEASGCPQPPDIELFDEFPMTDNDEDTTRRVTDAFSAHFGAERVLTMEPVSGSEDFSVVPDAFGIPYTYWAFGGFPADAEPVANHSPFFGPVLQPTLDTGTESNVCAALAFLGPES